MPLAGLAGGSGESGVVLHARQVRGQQSRALGPCYSSSLCATFCSLRSACASLLALWTQHIEPGSLGVA